MACRLTPPAFSRWATRSIPANRLTGAATFLSSVICHPSFDSVNTRDSAAQCKVTGSMTL
jgi:hypothetical protein